MPPAKRRELRQRDPRLMGGAHRKPTLFSRRTAVPDALRGREYPAAARTARLSVAVGTALTLVTGSGAAWGDVSAATHVDQVDAADLVAGHPADLVASDPVAGGGGGSVPPGPALSATFTLRRKAVPADPGALAGTRAGAPGSTNAAMARAAQAQAAAQARSGRHHAPAKAADPITTRIARASAAAEAVAEQLTEARVALQTLTNAQLAATANLAVAKTSTADAESAAASWTRESFIAQSSRPEGLVTDPRAGMLGRPEIGTAVLDLEAAEAQQRTASDAVARATAAVTTQRAHVATLQRNLDARGTELRKLRAAQASALIEAQRQRDAVEAALARKYLRDADGAAGKAALSAVNFALAQRGKPYEWGAEGPDRFDCSGLVQTAYARADVLLPRTARPQYRVSQPVSVTALLPGDLLFFATDHSDWNTIHHVGVYLGRGLMVHAPTTGDVVRVAPVWWSEFFAAGRVVPGRPGHRGEDVSLAALRPDRPVHRLRATPTPPTASPSPSTSAPVDPATATPATEAPKSASPSASETPVVTGSHTASPGQAHGRTDLPTATPGRTTSSPESTPATTDRTATARTSAGRTAAGRANAEAGRVDARRKAAKSGRGATARKTAKSGRQVSSARTGRSASSAAETGRRTEQATASSARRQSGHTAAGRHAITRHRAGHATTARKSTKADRGSSPRVSLSPSAPTEPSAPDAPIEPQAPQSPR